MKLFDLVVEPGRDEYIARHHVTVQEAREVVFAAPMIQRTRDDRYRLVGQTVAGRYLTVFLAPRGQGVYSLVTAREATEAERRLYRAQRRRSILMSTHRQSTPTASRIPTFQSIEEEAEFWDTHDSAEFEDEFEDVADVIVVPDRLENAVLVHLEAAELAALTERAATRGIRPSELVRQWILQHLDEPPAQ